MAAAKKKTTAKRSVKYAAKAQQSSAARTATKSSTATNAAWAKPVSTDWQMNANEWAKQSAKLLPFAQGDMGQAADTMKAASENMMKMGSDMMAQMFGKGAQASFSKQSFDPAAFFQNSQSWKAFDASSAQDKLSSFTREAAEQLAKTTSTTNRAAAEAMELSRENVEAMVEATNISVSVSKELGAELVTYMNKMFSQNVELSKQILSCRTLNDMFDLSSKLMKTNLDGFFSESVRMSEMLFQCATDVSEPLNERMTETTERLTKAMAA